MGRNSPSSQPHIAIFDSTYGSGRNSFEEAAESPDLPLSVYDEGYSQAPAWQRAQLIHMPPDPNRSSDCLTNSTTIATNSSVQHDGSFVVLGYPPLLEIDPKGTLALVLGSEEKNNGPRKVIVSPDIVRRLSPAWENIVSTQTHKSWPSLSQKKVRLTEDDPEIMILVMQVAHLQFKQLPDTLEYRQLLELALISHRYKTNHVLIPFLPKWTRPYQDKFLNDGMEEWMFIAYQFGYEDDYLMLAKHLTLHCTLNEDGSLIAPSGKPLKGHFPPGALRRIMSARQKLLQSFLNTTYQHVENMIISNTCQCTPSPTPSNPAASARYSLPPSQLPRRSIPSPLSSMITPPGLYCYYSPTYAIPQLSLLDNPIAVIV
ncbi:uncharacterized protein BDR25DRAFT_32270 [Lindgomyces ingoldianus]|uniref:Uncharacterized protein n=1 Tax=Lindgomyces ingoldianus TaxID=673940 RepID=A0ACB6QXE6_9PLEO|nr:uncharacterized protein BDR25DRAFT_32270 [Lindgomyces ingoldianus]KAF2470750.1 hypothetical protein BDR25DRAFT_32270 [Lindgomyces ingoldianus]